MMVLAVGTLSIVGATHGMLQDRVGWREPAIGMCTGKGSVGNHLSDNCKDIF